MLDPDDHRQLRQRLDLFHFQEEAPGMAFWHPRGFVLYRAIEEAIRRRMRHEHYLEVRTPQLLRRPIWEASGHWENFKDDMFVLEDSALKPVSCPGHLQIVQRMLPSYRDLPLRIGELGLCHRNENSGTLHGLFRLRQFTQDDGHIFCANEEQIASEVAAFCESLRSFYAGFDFHEFAVGFSTRPPKRAGGDAVWDRAETVLRAAAKSAGLDFEIQHGQGAFYGPKLEFVLRDRLGRAWQCGTIQLDFILPERFDVKYVDAGGSKQWPAMLHRALLGSLERFIGVLLEHHRGSLPAWLAPMQVVVAPIADAHRAYAERVLQRLREANLRAELDARSETLARRIVGVHEAGVPFLVIVGANEAAENTVTIRDRNKQRVLPIEEAITELEKACRPPI